MKPKLLAQQGDSILIQTQAAPKEATSLNDQIQMNRGFIHKLGSDFRYPEQLLGSIFAHAPYFDKPEIQLSDEEIQAICNLPIRSYPGGPTQ